MGITEYGIVAILSGSIIMAQCKKCKVEVTPGKKCPCCSTFIPVEEVVIKKRKKKVEEKNDG